MRPRPALFVLLLAAAAAGAATAGAGDDPARQFAAFASAAAARSARVRVVYFNPRFKGWAKAWYEVGDPRIDVRKTDSLLTPVLGLVDLSMVPRQTTFAASKAAAEQLDQPIPRPGPARRVTLRYAYRDRTWSFLDGSYTIGSDRLAITTEAALAQAVQPWWMALAPWLGIEPPPTLKSSGARAFSGAIQVARILSATGRSRHP